ncbi:MAG: AsmA family protein [bacterium]
MNALRWLRIVGVLAALAVGVAALAISLIDPNDYKPEIAAWIKQQTGRDLTWHGDVELVFFPFLGINTGRVELSHRADFADSADAPMLAVERAEVRVELLPLLRDEWRLDAVTLHRPQVHLIRRADGIANWDDLTARMPLGDASPDAATPAALAVQGVSIADGRARWNDRAAGHEVRLSQINLAGGRLTPGASSQINLSFEAASDALPAPLHVALTSTARLAANLETISMHDTEVTARTESDQRARIAAELKVETISYALPTRATSSGALSANGDAAIEVGEAATADFHFALADNRITLTELRVNGSDGDLAVEMDELILPFRARDAGFTFAFDLFWVLNAAAIDRAWPRIVLAIADWRTALAAE